jgi:hypothetical protein
MGVPKSPGCTGQDTPSKWYVAPESEALPGAGYHRFFLSDYLYGCRRRGWDHQKVFTVTNSTAIDSPPWFV